MDNAADVHVSNNLRLIMDYLSNPTRVRGLTSDGILSGRRTIKIRLAKENHSKRLILNLQNIFYLPNNLSNLISLELLNNASIYHNNKNQTLYDKVFSKSLAFAQHQKTSFLLHSLNLFTLAINLLKTNNNVNKNTMP